MAALRKTIARWEKVSTSAVGTGRTMKVRNEYALREDGVLLTQLTVDGHRYGWKIRARNPKALPELDRAMTARGCHRVAS